MDRMKDGTGREAIACHKVTLLYFSLHISNLKVILLVVKDDTLTINFHRCLKFFLTMKM